MNEIGTGSTEVLDSFACLGNACLLLVTNVAYAQGESAKAELHLYSQEKAQYVLASTLIPPADVFNQAAYTLSDAEITSVEVNGGTLVRVAVAVAFPDQPTLFDPLII